tara:strand:+ start:124 stop:2244 length:2121 start_codon:yes stop_codon:yes gene_type:complete
MEKVIDVKVNIEQAKKNFNDVNESIKLQEKFVSDLRLKIAELEFEMSKMNGTQKMMAEQTLTKFNAELKVEAAALRALKVEASQYNKVLKTQSTRTQVGRVKALEFNETLLKNRDIQAGLNTITGGLSGQIVKFGKLFVSASKGIKVAGIALNGFKKALIATGIGAIVVLVGLLVANFDKLKDAVNGVSSAQKNNLETAKQTVAEEQARLDITNSQDETLKRQGKSEKEILKLKINQTNEVIEALKIQLEQEKQIKASQVAAAERNQKILAGIVGFISAPVTLILGLIDAATALASKVPGLNIEATSLAKDFTMGAAKFVFDPEEVADEGDAVIEETEKKLTQLTNTRDGYLNSIDDMDKKSNDKRVKDTEENQKKIDNILNNFQKQRQDKEAKTNAEKVDLQKQRAIEELKALGATKEEIEAVEAHFADLRAEAVEKDQEKINNIMDKYATQLADREAVTHEQKMLLRKERAIEEAELAGANADQIAQIEMFYSGLITDAQIKDQQDLTKATEEEEAARLSLKMQALDSAISIANEESAVGRALIVAKQILLAKEAVLNFKKNLINATSAMTGVTITASEAATETTASIAKAANVAPPPLNLPFIATALATAASVISAVKAAVGATKDAASKAGGGGGGLNPITPPPTIPTQAPSFNIVGASAENQLAQTIADQTQQPIQAFVVANDVTTAQGLERNIIQESSLG